MQTKKIIRLLLVPLVIIAVVSCSGNKKTSNDMEKEYEKGTFGYDLKYLSDKDSLIVLKSDDEKAQVIVSARYQAKVFTSTANGLKGKSHGFINYNFFDSGVVDEHMNGFGGEDRFWLGPEGGKYSVYFEQGKEQVFDNWHTPKSIDIEPWEIAKSSEKEAVLTKYMEIKNYQGNILNIDVERTIKLLSETEISSLLDIKIPSKVNVVAYSTDNKITNRNNYEWSEKTGTVCVWMLDMFNPSEEAVTIIPFNEGDESKLGTIVTADYFGQISADRLKEEKGTLYFKTDGKSRGKLGMNAKRTKNIAGNYDPISNRLTVVTFTSYPDATYLNQEWNPDKNPLVGDALNAYNDGPLADGSIMGPFLELESCSPAAFLKPTESLSHIHNVFHFVGEESYLSEICERLLGVSLKNVKTIF